MTFDLDAVVKEDPGAPFDFIFGGEKYQLPPQPDVLAMAALAAGSGPKVEEGLRKLFGVEQHRRLMASPEVLSGEKLDALLNAYQEHLGGVGLGESKGSAGS